MDCGLLPLQKEETFSRMGRQRQEFIEAKNSRSKSGKDEEVSDMVLLQL